jgi:hypothetical protein
LVFIHDNKTLSENENQGSHDNYESVKGFFTLFRHKPYSICIKVKYK